MIFFEGRYFSACHYSWALGVILSVAFKLAFLIHIKLLEVLNLIVFGNVHCLLLIRVVFGVS